MAETTVAAQMYTLREFTKTPADIASSLKKVAAMGYGAIQSSGMGPIDPKELKSIADGEGLTICATHTSYDRMKDDPDGVIEEHQLWGCSYPAIASMPGPRDVGEEGFRAFAREASDVAARLGEGGMIVSYHNHSFELVRFGNKTGLDVILEEGENLQLEIDTYWIQHGGGDSAAWIRKAKGRADLVHVKDMIVIGGREQMFAEVGEGNLNWPAIMDACKEAGTKWYIVEQDRCDRDPFDSLEISLKALQGMGLS